MREAVEHPSALSQPAHRKAVIFLVEEEAGFLPVFHVDTVINSVFANLGHGALGVLVPVPALELRKTLKRADGNVITLEDAGYLLTVCAKNLKQNVKQRVLNFLHADRQGLHHQNVGESVHGQPRKAVRLTENHAAAGDVLPHDGLSVIPGVLHAPAPEVFVHAVVRVSGNKAQSDLAAQTDKTGAEVLALFADGVGNAAVFNFALNGDDLALVYPGVSLLDPRRALFRDCDFRQRSVCFH